MADPRLHVAKQKMQKWDLGSQLQQRSRRDNENIPAVVSVLTPQKALVYSSWWCDRAFPLRRPAWICSLLNGCFMSSQWWKDKESPSGFVLRHSWTFCPRTQRATSNLVTTTHQDKASGDPLWSFSLTLWLQLQTTTTSAVFRTWKCLLWKSSTLDAVVCSSILFVLTGQEKLSMRHFRIRFHEGERPFEIVPPWWTTERRSS